MGYGERLELKRIKALTKTELKELNGPNKSYRDSAKVHEAVCTDCGKKCEVPFKPNPKRPVYCKRCWSGYKALITKPY